jgi:hypothetical protein
VPTRLQVLRDQINHLERKYARLQHDKDLLEKAWSEEAKVALPGLKKQMDEVLTAIREAEAEVWRIVSGQGSKSGWDFTP